ncbi:hypothetical protein [Mucilaginibacter glaciei]|uniref:Uncharacterized protein n=1 Tax=Mucilaginibacter glaciei TaxID=2772109 RepID=A0A926NYX4_9SPHI|nr:hypothetical protein [Mucilaginibacter glaciei]MBD1394453.1 hypothetical protein [Mucilaginibacter glaciei]
MPNTQLRFINLKTQPFGLFLLMAAVFFIASFISPHKTVDVNLRDTYFVITIAVICRLLALILLIIWIIYLLSNRVLLSIRLTWAHILLSILPLIALLIILGFYTPQEALPTRYFTFTKKESSVNWNLIYATLIAIPLAGQLILLLNVIGGLFKNRRLDG